MDNDDSKDKTDSVTVTNITPLVTAMARPLKNKSGGKITAQFLDILDTEQCQPMQLCTDKGKEFFNGVFQSLLRQRNTKHYTTQNQEIKATNAERLQRSIKARMFTFFTNSNNYRWVDVLQQIISSYNESYHGSIGTRPIDVTYDNQDSIWLATHESDSKVEETRYGFDIGDKVRLSKYSTVFKKGYLPSWTPEIFSVADRHSTKPPTYSIKDDEGHRLEGTWYEPELQKVEVTDNVYKIESTLGQRKVNGKTQYLVRWAGYPPSFDSYVNKADLIHNYKN